MNDSSGVAPALPAAQRIDSRDLSAAVSAFLVWGLMPLYMKLLQTLPVLQITAHRMVWGCLVGLGWLAARGETNETWSAFGVVCFRERLHRMQWLSVTIAAAGVLYLTWAAGKPPYVSIALACAVLLFGEPFSGPRVVGFAMIWTALAVFALDGVVSRQRG